jgi:clan AA aspartic protease
MGITFVDGTVSGPGGEVEVRFLVDSGAGYSQVPEGVWSRIGLQPVRRQSFTLADGSIIERDIGTCTIRLEFGETPTPVVLGGPDDPALLGVVTLEELGVLLNPYSRRLQPMTMRL